MRANRFSEVAGLVLMTVKGVRGVTVGTRREDRFGSGRLEGFHAGVGVVALVGGDGLGAGGFRQEAFGVRDVRFRWRR